MNVFLTTRYKVSKVLFLILLIQASRSVNSVDLFGAYPEIYLGIISLFYLIYIRFKFNRGLLVAIAIWSIYFVFSSIYVNAFSPLLYVRIPLLFITGYAIAKEMKIEIVHEYTKIIYILSSISLFFYAWTLIDSNSLLVFMKFFGKSDGGGNYGIWIFNIKERAIYRNSGFCWEPGPFASFVVMAFLFEMAKSNFKFLKKHIILILTLASTQSSTGVSLLLLVFMLWLFINLKRSSYLLLASPIVLGGLLFLLQEVPFLRDKIETEFNEIYEEDRILELGRSRDEAIGTGRFMQFMITWNDIKERPFLGFSSNPDLQYVERNNLKLFSSGLGGYIARYGLIMFFLFLLLVKKSGDELGGFFRQKYFSFIWLMFFLALAFSFSSIAFSSLFFCFYMMSMVRFEDDSRFLTVHQ